METMLGSVLWAASMARSAAVMFGAIVVDSDTKAVGGKVVKH